MNLVSPRFLTVVLLAFATVPLCAQTQQPKPNRARTSSGTSIAIVVDDSEAARKQFNNLRDGVLAFAHAFGDEDELCLVGLGGKPHLLHDLTFDPQLIDQSIRNVRPQGPPNVSEALKFANEQLKSEAENDNTVIVLFVGSEPDLKIGDASPSDPSERNIPVHVIAGPGADWHLQEKLQTLTSSSGGRAIFPPSDKQFREAAAATGKQLSATKDIVATKQAGTSNQKRRGEKLLIGYQEVTVRNIPVAENRNTEQFMGGDNLLLQRVLVERLRRSNLFPSVIDGNDPRFTVANGTSSGGGEPPAPGKKLELRATIVKYDRGSRMRRQFTFGGDARIGLQVNLVDAATGQSVDSFNTEGSAYVGGVFGGSQESVLAKAMLDVANKVLREVRDQR